MSTDVDTAVQPLIERLYRTRHGTTCYHESGHAVAALATGMGVQLATVVPTENWGGFVRPQRRPDGFAGWAPSAITCAAGMVAGVAVRHEQWHRRPPIGRRGTSPGKGEVIMFRRVAAIEGGAKCGGEEFDLRRLRGYARRAWWAIRDGETDGGEFGDGFDPAWAKRPYGVRYIAEYIWARAVHLIAERWGEVTAVAELLDRHPDRAVCGFEVETAVENATPALFDASVIGVDFWPARYSRMKWRPVGMCRED